MSWLAIIPIFILIVLAFSAGLGFLFQMLWNFTLPGLFGAPEITFLQAWALWILVSMVGAAFRAVVSSKD